MRKNLAIVFLSLTFLIPAVSHAARDYGRSPLDYGGQVYLTIKYGETTIADSVPENGSDIRNLGFVFGKGINDVLAMEFEYTTTVSKDDDYGGSDLSASTDILGLFLVAKTAGDIYVRGRIGYTRVTQDFGSSASGLFDDLSGQKNIYGVGYGVGAGYKFMKGGAVELEYMVYPTRDDVDFGGNEVDLEMDFISLNYVMSFD
jgi:opacity protein-like surface antigen